MTSARQMSSRTPPVAQSTFGFLDDSMSPPGSARVPRAAFGVPLKVNILSTHLTPQFVSIGVICGPAFFPSSRPLRPWREAAIRLGSPTRLLPSHPSHSTFLAAPYRQQTPVFAPICAYSHLIPKIFLRSKIDSTPPGCPPNFQLLTRNRKPSLSVLIDKFTHSLTHVHTPHFSSKNLTNNSPSITNKTFCKISSLQKKDRLTHSNPLHPPRLPPRFGNSHRTQRPPRACQQPAHSYTHGPL